VNDHVHFTQVMAKDFSVEAFLSSKYYTVLKHG